MSITFGQARDQYANRADLHSSHTLQAYLRAIDLLLEYLADRHFEPQMPVQQQALPAVEQIPIQALQKSDEALLKHFATWMQTPSSSPDSKRPYAASTIELRMAGVQRWFEFMQAQGWLPDRFSLGKAVQQYKDGYTVEKTDEETDKAVDVPDDLSPILRYYATQRPPKQVKKNAERFQRWELTRLRNNALLKTLAETGGQISAILSINADALNGTDDEVIIEVTGKNEHTYHIYLKESLPALRDYLRKREIPTEQLEKTPLFVSHDPRYDGNRMSRIIAWRIVQRAAKAVGLPEVTPHHLRHWRALKLIEDGVPLEDVKERLGHRSMHTIRSYYGHLLDDENTDDDQDENRID